jgi:hypothetical protein
MLEIKSDIGIGVWGGNRPSAMSSMTSSVATLPGLMTVKPIAYNKARFLIRTFEEVVGISEGVVFPNATHE